MDLAGSFCFQQSITTVKQVWSTGQDLENDANSFPVGNLLVGWCSVSALSSVAVNTEVQGNKLRVGRK